MSFFLQVFFPRMWEERCWRVSVDAKLLLEELAASAGDPQLLNWIKSHNAFEFDGAVSGYVRPPKAGRPMRVGLKRRLLAEPKVCRTRFAAAHELGHVRQVLQGQTPATLFTCDLYRQQMEASGFAAVVLERAGCQGNGWWYKSWLKHFPCAMQAAYPAVFHSVAAVALWVGSYLVGRWTGVVTWLADRLAPLLASTDQLADIQAAESV